MLRLQSIDTGFIGKNMENPQEARIYEVSEDLENKILL